MTKTKDDQVSEETLLMLASQTTEMKENRIRKEHNIKAKQKENENETGNEKDKNKEKETEDIYR